MPPTKSLTSQGIIDDFWKIKLTPTAAPLKAIAILPRNVSTHLFGQQVVREKSATTSVSASYDEAKTVCKAKIARIIKECRRKNQKYSDTEFNLDYQYECIDELSAIENSRSPSPSRHSTQSPTLRAVLRDPACAQRVGDIFENPQFFVEETTAKNINQGDGSTCWFIAALSTVRNCKLGQDLIRRVCVDRDEEVGVYGFLFFRDGEWTSVIVDDKLFLRVAEYEGLGKIERNTWEDHRIRVEAVEDYRKMFQTNSRALVYGHSSHPDETWVPLLEKAFAKAHGDYQSITGGSFGNGVEDLTGGITTKINIDSVLSKNRLWEEGLCKVNVEFLFGCSTHTLHDPYTNGRDGIFGDHAYSILRAESYGSERLLMVMNPWGRGEWNGPWSDGSSQWTAEAIKDLGHVFGDDGVFWIRFEDFLRKFQFLYQTRLFTADWNVTQRWTHLMVPWAGLYQNTKFEIAIARAASTVIVLSQLDRRYFRGLAGQYQFQQSFELYRSDQTEYIISSGGEEDIRRSVSVELDLEAGIYEVRLKVTAVRDDVEDKPEDVIKSNWLERKEKLLRIGLNHDLAHAKAEIDGMEEREDEACKARLRNEVCDSMPRIQGDQLFKIGPVGADEQMPRGRSGDKVVPVKEKKPKRDRSEEPWSASCVVGLRVYTKDAEAAIRVVDTQRDSAKLLNSGVDESSWDVGWTTGRRLAIVSRLLRRSRSGEKKPRGATEAKRNAKSTLLPT